MADLLSEHNKTLVEKLFVILQYDRYILAREKDSLGFEINKQAGFYDNQKAHNSFWLIYERPPKEEYWDYIIERRDLLVPQDIRERKGSFFTPRIWVEKSQDYIAKVLGEDWQDEYYVWDCAAGTGNLLTGLTNKYRIWASTLDKADVEIMKERVKNGANLLEGNIFQFDFLNDSFDKLPKSLQEVLNDEKKRKKLVIYINPPYAESGSGTGKHKAKVSSENDIYLNYKNLIADASKELFALFLIRIFKEIPNCIIAEFSTLKSIQASNFIVFRNIFKSKLENIFIVPANTFDNVKGEFPIGFKIWNTAKIQSDNYSVADVFNRNSNFIGNKKIYFYSKEEKNINYWIDKYKNKSDKYFSVLMGDSPDFQNNKYVSILNHKEKRHGKFITINENNFLQSCIYFSVRHCIEATWLNDRDQFLYPKDTWQDDLEFQSDCIAFTLFDDKNRISAEEGTNHFIPFTEEQLGVLSSFDSHFIIDFINGDIKTNNKENMFEQDKDSKIHFSPQAKAVFEAGLELYKYYHTHNKEFNYNHNASYYDIRLFFQGRNDKGRMNSTSKNETYNTLLKTLKSKMSILADKIAIKVYEHGFLRE